MKIKIDGELYDVDNKQYKRGVKRVILYKSATDLVVWELKPNSVTPTIIFLSPEKHPFLDRLVHNIWGEMAKWTFYKEYSEEEGLDILKQYKDFSYE